MSVPIFCLAPDDPEEMLVMTATEAIQALIERYRVADASGQTIAAGDLYSALTDLRLDLYNTCGSTTLPLALQDQLGQTLANPFTRQVRETPFRPDGVIRNLELALHQLPAALPV